MMLPARTLLRHLVLLVGAWVVCRAGVCVAEPEPEAAAELRPAALTDPLEIPLEARYRIADGKLPAWFGDGVEVQAQGKGLLFTDATHRFPRIPVGPHKPKLLHLGTREAPRDALVFHDPGGWCVGVATVWEGRVMDHAVALLDADLDGRFTPGRDCIRWGEGVMRRITSHRLVPLGLDRAHFEIRSGDGRLSIVLTRLVERAGTAEQRACLLACNEVRARLYGLPPLRLDPVRCEACQRHATYLYIDNHDFQQAWDGVGSHGEVPGHPGYSVEGAEAGRNSTIAGHPDAARTPREQARTMIHRIPWLGPPGAGLGVGVEGRSKNTAVAGYSVCWAPGIHGAPREWFPILVPAPGARGVPRTAAPERPAPEDPTDAYATARGVPVSVTFGTWRLANIRLRLVPQRPRGAQAVAGWLFTPDHPVHATRPDGESSALFLPQRPLEKRARYTAIFEADRGDEPAGPVRFVWSFETEP